jgi:putative ABC transport system permease protein
VNELFGVPMALILRILLGMLALAAGTGGWVLLRHRVLVVIAVRNARRRMTQTVLIIVGLMLSTLIISVALVIGDTVQYSIADRGIAHLHSVDETVRPVQQAGAEPPDARSPADLADAIRGLPGIDGSMPFLTDSVPMRDVRTAVSTRAATVVGADARRTTGFAAFTTPDGRTLWLSDLGEYEVYLDESLARRLGARPGDLITLFAGQREVTFIVRDIARDRTLTGASEADPAGLVMRLGSAQELLRRWGAVDGIAVSNSGGMFAGLGSSNDTATMLNSYQESSGAHGWTAEATKQVLADRAASTASRLTAFFAVLGLFEIASGILLVFLVFLMLASERKTELGVMRAIGTQRQHLVQTFLIEGMVYNVPAAAIGSALGLVASMAIVRALSGLFTAFGLAIVFHATARSLLIAYSAGVVLTFVATVGASWRVSELNIVEAIRGLPGSYARTRAPMTLVAAVPCFVLAAALAVVGARESQTLSMMLALTAGVIGTALAARYAAAPRRLLSSGTGVLLGAGWPLGVGGRLPGLHGADTGVQTFVVAGLMMICATTFVIIENADALLRVVTVFGRLRSRLIPAIRTAVAYPQTHRARSGLTIALISLVVFSLVLMSAMNANFGRMFLGQDATGGYDVMVHESGDNKLPDLVSALQATNYDTRDIASVDRIAIDGGAGAQVRQLYGSDGNGSSFASYPMVGMSPSFIEHNGLKLQARADGYGNDRDVWNAILRHDNLAVIDASAINGGQFNLIGSAPFSIQGVNPAKDRFSPVRLEVRDAASGKSREVTVIGVITLKAAQTFRGVFLSPWLFGEIYGDGGNNYDLVRLRAGTDSAAAAQGIGDALVLQGAEATALRQIVEDNQAFSRGMLYLSEAFMGVGLLVGVSAMGMIAFRTVIERRQQIGMLRAIGFTRGNVALTMALESVLVALLGVASGVFLGLLLASEIVRSNQLSPGGAAAFAIPWLQVGGIALVALGASLVMTIVPARRAGAIEIADALRSA